MTAGGLSEKGKWHNEADVTPSVITISTKEELEKLGNERNEGIIVIRGDLEEFGRASYVVHLIREKGLTSPIVYLTHDKALPSERIKFYDAGGDTLLEAEDRQLLPKILTKLHRRVRFLAESREPLQPFEGFILDNARAEVRIHGRPIHVTGLEFRTVQLLVAKYPGFVTRELFAEEVCAGFGSDSNLLAALIKKIRNKIVPFRVMTVRGKGYRLSPD